MLDYLVLHLLKVLVCSRGGVVNETDQINECLREIEVALSLVNWVLVRENTDCLLDGLLIEPRV